MHNVLHESVWPNWRFLEIINEVRDKRYYHCDGLGKLYATLYNLGWAVGWLKNMGFSVILI